MPDVVYKYIQDTEGPQMGMDQIHIILGQIQIIGKPAVYLIFPTVNP